MFRPQVLAVPPRAIREALFSLGCDLEYGLCPTQGGKPLASVFAHQKQDSVTEMSLSCALTAAGFRRLPSTHPEAVSYVHDDAKLFAQFFQYRGKLVVMFAVKQ